VVRLKADATLDRITGRRLVPFADVRELEPLDCSALHRASDKFVNL
jgi:hypothetical protein